MRTRSAIPLLLTLAVVLAVGHATWREASPALTAPPPLGTPGAPSTSRESLAQAIERLEARIAVNPDDLGAAVRLADALVRQARVASDGALAVRAEAILEAALRTDPGDYEARRMLAVVYLAQHRFRDAVSAAARARARRPRDAWNYGVIGDGYLELGDYDRAFDAYDEMVRLKPNAAAYARVSHARELQGDWQGALDAMRMAAEATSAHDPESQAWHYAQIGQLLLQMGRLGDARREYERAAFTFPGHPYAVAGIARVKAAQGDYGGALADYGRLMATAPTPEIAAQIGDLHLALGRPDEAERYYETAERLERDGWRLEQPQPAALARFLAERRRKIDEAVRLAEQGIAERRDIYSEDALAWACFQAGRLAEARRASDRALRTGTRDRRILYHAAAIRAAAGAAREARELLDRVLDGHPRFDLIAADEAARLRARLDGRM